MKVFYRLEDPRTGLGPFRNLNSEEKEMLIEYWESIPNFENIFPSPEEDSKVLEQKKDLIENKNLELKFCCLTEVAIFEYFGPKLTNHLLKKGYVIQEYIEGIKNNQ